MLAGGAMKDVNELFENCSIDDLVNGYTIDQSEDELVCLICGKRYHLDEVFPQNQKYFSAHKMIKMHLETEHKGILPYLLGLDKKISGISEQQSKILTMISQGFPDNDIAREIGEISPSTIRNHRFVLREKVRQSRVFLAIMEIVEKSIQQNKKFIQIHRTAKNIDERYSVTEEENQTMLKTYMNNDGQIIIFPRKEKIRLVLLRQIVQKFEPGRKYSEREVNQILIPIYSDYVVVRRLLIDYHFLDRTADGKEYWVK